MDAADTKESDHDHLLWWKYKESGMTCTMPLSLYASVASKDEKQISLIACQMQLE